LILQCSECQARYLLPDNAVGVSGRTVRCARCSHTWFQPPTEESAKEALASLDEMLSEIKIAPKPIPKGSNLPAVKKRKAPHPMVVGTGVAAVAAILSILLFAAPQFVGLPRSQGLMLGDVGIVKVADDKNLAYQISGVIVNMGDHPKVVPNLRVTLVDDNGMPLQYWDFGGDINAIEPTKSVPFSTGNLPIRFSKGTRFVVELGNPLELALRRKPAPQTVSASDAS